MKSIAPTLLAACVLIAPGVAADAPPRVSDSTHNLLADAKTSGNLASYDKGQRGQPGDMAYDLQRRQFVRSSPWHEYGVGMGREIGVIAEDKPAWWMAEWTKPVQANLIVLSGGYPNQPQPETCWKIELRRDDKWTTHARGQGGWYNAGRYVWGGAAAELLAFDAVRVSVFSKDDQTPLKSIHFRGEEGVSWLVAKVVPIDARIVLPAGRVRAGSPAAISAEAAAGEIKTWQWDFGDGGKATGREVTHTFAKPGRHEVTLSFSDGEHTASVRQVVTVAASVIAGMAPLTGPVMAGEAFEMDAGPSVGKVAEWAWDFGDGTKATGGRVKHTFASPGIYRVKLTVGDGGAQSDQCEAIVRAHTAQTLHVPQVLLDTDQKNEQDDQHYFGYGLFSELDLLGINSVHHGGGQEEVNYREILHVLDLARKSSLPEERVPVIFRGADQRLDVPADGRWDSTQPIDTEASRGILAAVRGASPTNPVWVVPVGPGTNVACAILQARELGLKLDGRLRVMWLGGSNTAVTGEFNGNNDPWSMYVVCSSGLETWIMPAPVGARVRVDKRTESELYADNPLGQYLLKIVPARAKALYDPSCLSAIISMRLNLGWVKETEPVTVGGPKEGYRWTKTDQPTAVLVIRQLDSDAMKADIFDSMKGRPRKLIGVPARPQGEAAEGK